MKLTRLKIALAAASICGFALSVSPVPALAAVSGCTTGSSSGNVLTCFSINGESSFVAAMTATGSVVANGSTRTIQECIHGPDTQLPKCTAFVTTSPGNTVPVLWTPSHDLNGTFCARTWRLNSDSTTTLIGEQCFDVHS